jgi:hypothetical protein
MEGQTAFIESGHVWIPREAPWLQEFLHELVMFPNGRFDDQVDSMSQALDYARNHHVASQSYSDLVMEHIRAKQAAAGPPTLRVFPPVPGRPPLYTAIGRTVSLEPGGYFLLTNEEWAALCWKPGWLCDNEFE